MEPDTPRRLTKEDIQAMRGAYKELYDAIERCLASMQRTLPKGTPQQQALGYVRRTLSELTTINYGWLDQAEAEALPAETGAA